MWIICQNYYKKSVCIVQSTTAQYQFLSTGIQASILEHWHIMLEMEILVFEGIKEAYEGYLALIDILLRKVHESGEVGRICGCVAWMCSSLVALVAPPSSTCKSGTIRHCLSVTFFVLKRSIETWRRAWNGIEALDGSRFNWCSAEKH